MTDIDARLWHPWLRINRVLRVMLQTRWSAEAWSVVRLEFRRAVALWRRTSNMFSSSLTFNQVTSNATLDPDVVTTKMRWFKNIKRQPFDAGQESLDYSL